MSDTEDSAPEPAPEPAPDPVDAEPDPGAIPLETITAGDEPDPGPITLTEEWRSSHFSGIERDE
jgi:hypothetical protein